MRLTFILLFMLPFLTWGQNETMSTLEPKDTVKQYIRKATLLSTALPGAGQVYNKKYWKVPIVYAGLGTCIYFIQDNTRNLNEFKTALIAAEDDDPLTINNSGFTSSQLDEIVDTYYRWRDISWMALGAVYILNIIDAHVDAHLHFFDVDDRLTLGITPLLSPNTNTSVGISLSLNF